MRLNPEGRCLAVILVAVLAACGKSSGHEPVPDATPIAPGFDKRAVLESSADCAIAQYTDFEQVTAALVTAASAHAAARSAETAAALKTATGAATASWQIAEIYQFGPSAPSSEPGGQDLRDQIYAWPLVSRCKVEEQLVAKIYAAPGFDATLINGRGLGALEYLVFYEGTDNACSPFSVINSQGSWAALSADELARRKADYALAVATDLHARASVLLAAWKPGAGDFRTKLVSAGAGSPVFASLQGGLNAVSNALFYLDQQVKDDKVARPIGLMDCETETCPEAVESLFARDALARIQANLLGFERLTLGCDVGPGFDDWLIAAGASELAARLVAAIAAARAAATAVGPSFDEALASDKAKLVELHVKLKAVTDLMKSEFVSVLDLELPSSVEGDND